MLEIVRVGAISTYPSGKNFRQLLLKDTKTDLEAVYSMKEAHPRNANHLWWHIIEELDNCRYEFEKMEGEIVSHTKSVLSNEVTLNVVLMKGKEMGSRKDWISWAWKDQYTKVIEWDVINTTNWVWNI